MRQLLNVSIPVVDYHISSNDVGRLPRTHMLIVIGAKLQ